MTATSPLPVAMPIRIARPWKRISAPRREQEDPQERVAEVRAEDRVGRDPGGIVVGDAGEEPGPTIAMSASSVRARARLAQIAA